MKKITLFLAVRNIKHKKLRSIVMLLGMTFVLIMVITLSIIQEASISQNKYEAMQNYGNWQLCFLANDNNAVDQVKTTNIAEAVFTGYRIQPTTIKNEEISLDLSIIESNGLPCMAPNLVIGRYPTVANEIVIQNWYLLKNKITKLPIDITVGNEVYHVTGAYQTAGKSINSQTLKAFGLKSVNSRLINSDSLSKIPVDNNYVLPSSQETIREETDIRPFLFIKIKKGVSISTAVDKLENCSSLGLYKKQDQLDITKKPNATPYYNTNLIASVAQNDSDPFSNMSPNVQLIKNSIAVDILLIVVLIFVISVLMNVAIAKDIRELGLLLAIGVEPKRLIFYQISQMAIYAVISLPIGLFSGIGIAFIALNKYDYSIIPWPIVITFVLAYLFSILGAAVYPSIKVARRSPLDAIVGKRNKKEEFNGNGLVNLNSKHGQFLFSVLFALKNSFINWERSLGIIFVVALLLGLFTQFTKEIEMNWKLGDERKGYSCDYTIRVPYVSFSSQGPAYYNDSIKPINNQFFDQLSKIDGVKTIFSQSSIVDCTLIKDKNDLHNCYFVLKNNVLTKQGKQCLKYLDNIDSLWDNNGIDYVRAGIGGYDDRGLDIAKKYLVEGTIDIDKMKKEPIILLPKYISDIGNMDVPYSNLKVGDKITLIEDSETGFDNSNIKPLNEYIFTIGGFVDTLPFPQINGVSNGFVAIMSNEQLQRLSTPYKGINEVYISKNVNSDPSTKIKNLCVQYNYEFTNNTTNFEYIYQNSIKQKTNIIIYTIFAVIAFIVFITLFYVFFCEIITRKAEFALLFSIGMTKWQIMICNLAEIVFLGFIGCILGIAFGIILALNFSEMTLGSEMLTWFQQIPWAHIWVGISVIILSSIIALVTSTFYCIKSVSVNDIEEE